MGERDEQHLEATGWKRDGERWRDPQGHAVWSTEQAAKEQRRREARDGNAATAGGQGEAIGEARRGG